MKFTRMFIVKTLNPEYSNLSQQSNQLDNEDHIKVLSDALITNSNIDFLISLILTFLFLTTSINNDLSFQYENPLNFYLIAKIHFNLIILYFLIIFICFTLTHPSNSLTRPSIPQRPSANAMSDLLLIKTISQKFSFPIPNFVYKYWHTFIALFHFIKTFLFIFSFGLSMAFWVVYSGQKNLMELKCYYAIHIIIAEIYYFYSLFRFCYFVLKVSVNIILFPMHISAIFLGYIEDKFNFELNELINTKEYQGRTSVISNKSNMRKSELEDYCSICLNPFQYGNTVSTLPCNKRHMFHTVCLEKWFYTTVSCPLCRSNFSDKIEELVPHGRNGVMIQMEEMNNNNPFQQQNN